MIRVMRRATRPPSTLTCTRTRVRTSSARRGRRILLETYATDLLLSEWTWMRESGGDTAPFWAEIKRRALDNDHLCAEVVAGVEAGEQEARETAP